MSSPEEKAVEVAENEVRVLEDEMDSFIAEASEQERKFFALGKSRGRGDAFMIALSVERGGGTPTDVRQAIAALVKMESE